MSSTQIKPLKNKCDLVIFPELSIPFLWLPPMVRFARKNDVALVFGLEYVVNNNKASNIIVTILPYEKNENKEKKCFIKTRLKNHYAPKEKEGLRHYDISPKKEGNHSIYNIFEWKGVFFSVYNCFELTDIKHRSLMRGEIDFLASIAWNPDVIYYDKILSSTSRDLQAYIIHANTSQYGGSTIIAPKKDVEKEYVKIKGGDSSVLIKSEIDIGDLRDFQIKCYDPKDERYKPLPAGFERYKVKIRLKNMEK